MKLLFAIAAVILPIAAHAQTAPAPGGGDIVVTGRKDADRKAAEAYVGEVSVRSDNQLARFHQVVCPLVIGMPAQYAAIMQERIRTDARAAGIEVAKKIKCDANLIVVVAQSGLNLVRDIRINRSGWLEGLDPVDIDKLLVPGPVRAWSVTSLRNADGQLIYTPPGGSGGVGDPLGDIPTLRVMSASIIRQPSRRDMEASFVVIDEAATVGLTLRQIADYAAMRGLARTRPSAASGAAIGTILSLFDASENSRVRELTAADNAYLRALYKESGTMAANNEKTSIALRIAKRK